MTPSLICHICLWSLSVFISNPAFLGLFPAADDLWAASVCYTCVRCIYSGKPRLLIFAGRTVYCHPPASCPWNEATFWGGGGAVTAGLEKGFTLLEMWPWKYIVKVYFSINVYRIPPPPLQTQLLTGLSSGIVSGPGQFYFVRPSGWQVVFKNSVWLYVTLSD